MTKMLLTADPPVPYLKEMYYVCSPETARMCAYLHVVSPLYVMEFGCLTVADV